MKIKNDPCWKPNASVKNLIKRTKIINKIRDFFNKKKIKEVETPILTKHPSTDINFSLFKTNFIDPNKTNNQKLYLVTSPEHHMKRLIASGIGSIYQISKAFRNQEKGKYHNPEFTILEWYRPHYNTDQLIREINSFLQTILKCKQIKKFSYQKIFQKYLNIDPLSKKTKNEIINLATNYGYNNSSSEKKDILLQFLFNIKIQPNLGLHRPTVIYHYPASQAISAKINKNNPKVAERFELYFKGIELANGSLELTNSDEQKKRFLKDIQIRKKLNMNVINIDTYLLSALHKTPFQYSGVAFGLDRLIMLASNQKKINKVISFTIERA